MKNRLLVSSPFVLVAALTGSTVLAQLNTTVNAVSQTAASAAGSVGAGRMGPSTVNAGSTIGAGAQGALGAGSISQGALGAAAAPGALPEPGIRASAGLDAGARAGVNASGVSAGAEKSAAASAALDMASTIHTINQTAFEARKEVLAQMDGQLEAT